MTNPTQTRAEIQAEIEKLQEPADAEPVAYFNVYPNGRRFCHVSKQVALDSVDETATEVAVPLYRRPFDPVAILECAEGMSAYRHGSDGFIAYRKRLCGLLGVDAGTELDCMNLTPMPIAAALLESEAE